MITLKEISEKLFGEKSVAIFCHIRPDGDAVGSALALYKALLSRGIKAEVFCDDTIPERFFYLADAKDIKRTLSGGFSAFCAVDCAALHRLGAFKDAFFSHKNTYSIDHHVSNERFARYNYVSEKASNSENIYELARAANVEINGEIAERLLTGIATDTGAFRHKNVSGETLAVASELVFSGADIHKIIFNNFVLQSKERAFLFGAVMQKLRYFSDGKFVLATVRLTDIEKSGAKQDETEGFIDFIMGIKGVEIGACVMETEKDKFKVSLRSSGADVGALAAEFGGGGHTLASGCRIVGEYEEVVDRLRFAASKYLP